MVGSKLLTLVPPVLGRWETVTPPAAWAWSLPFTIQRRGRVFRPAPSFSLYAYAMAQIPAGTTYYVSKATGNDSNDGLSWATAKKSLNAAMLLADARIIYVAAGYHYRYDAMTGGIARSMAIIGVGDVYLTSDETDRTGAWSAVDNHYEAANSRTITQAYDSTNPDANGKWGLMTKCAASGDVDGTPNSWYKSGAGTLYMRTHDGREPDTSIRLIPTTGAGPSLYGAQDKILYLANLKVYGGNAPLTAVVHSSAPGTVKLYVENCEFGYSVSTSSTYNCASIWGVTESIIFNSKFWGSLQYDGINYKIYGGVVPKAIEYNVESFGHGDGSTDQPSTGHDGATIVRIMGKYYGCPGTTILADIGGGQSWCLGSLLYNPSVPATAGAFYVDTGQAMWLDRCSTNNLGASAKGVAVADAASAIRYRKLNTAGTLYNNGGTLETY